MLSSFARVSSAAYCSVAQSTVDSKEIAFFNARADKWWSEEGPFASLLSYNTVRVPFIEKQVSTCFAVASGKQRILDVGAGGGLLSEALAKKGYSVLGIDLAKDSIEVAKSHRDLEILKGSVGASTMQLEYRVADIEALRDEVVPKPVLDDPTHAVNEGRFDVVVASEVVEHVDNPPVFIKACGDCVKPGGVLVLTTPGKTWLSWFLLILLGEYVFGLLPQGTHHYSKFMSRQEMVSLAKANGFQQVAYSGCFYVPFMRRWFYEPTGWVMQLIAFQRTTEANKKD